MPRVKGVLADILKNEIEKLTSKADALIDLVTAMSPKTQVEAEPKLEMLTDYWGKRCGDYEKAAQLASQLSAGARHCGPTGITLLASRTAGHPGHATRCTVHPMYCPPDVLSTRCTVHPMYCHLAWCE
jgi:hypothetical protein